MQIINWPKSGIEVTTVESKETEPHLMKTIQDEMIDPYGAVQWQSSLYPGNTSMLHGASVGSNSLSGKHIVD